MSRAARVLAIDFGATKVALALARSDGERLRTVRIQTRAADGAEAAVRRTLEAARELIGTEAVDAVGVATPGLTLPDRILLAPNVVGWDQLALPSMLRDGLGVQRIAVANDVKAGGLAEARWGNLAGVGSGVFLNLGTGLAAALVLDGRVLAGAHGTAGEIAYSLLGRPGEPAWRDGHAPLEEYISGRALSERASALLERPVTAAEVFTGAGSDQRLRELLDDALEVLARHVANLVLVFDPARISLGGGLTAAAGAILPALRSTLDRAVPFPPPIVLARHAQDAPLVGAVVLAVDAATTG